jgi:hypothetical protein
MNAVNHNTFNCRRLLVVGALRLMATVHERDESRYGDADIH